MTLTLLPTTRNYISAEGAEQLKHYQYHGADKGLWYGLCNRLLYPWLVEMFPLWLAPNVITLAGLALVVISHCITWFYMPNMEGYAPWWVYVYNGVALITYQVLDNCDGKQARRTASSSPLGLLFDHGCDAMNAVVSAFTLASCLQCGPTWKALVLLILPCSVFYVATWEEYYTGQLVLAKLNGPGEGLLIISVTHIMSAFLPTGFWNSPSMVMPAVDNNTMGLLIGIVPSCITLITNFWTVLTWPGAPGSGPNSDHGFIVKSTRLTPLLVLTVGACRWAQISQLEGQDIYTKYPRPFMWTLGLIFCKLVTDMMVAHLTSQGYHPVTKTVMPAFYLIFHTAVAYTCGMKPNMDEVLVLRELLAISLVSYGHLVLSLIQEMTTILKINCFTIPYPKHKSK